MGEGITVATEDRYIQLWIVELECLLLLIYWPVFPDWHVFLTAYRVTSSLFRSLSGLAPRGSTWHKWNKRYIFPPVAAHPQLEELVHPPPTLPHPIVPLEAFFLGGLVRCPKVYFEIDHIILIGLLIPGGLAEGIGRGELIGDFSNEEEELLGAIGGSQGSDLFSNQLNFPNLGSFCEWGFLVEEGEDEEEGERGEDVPPETASYLVAYLVVLSVDEEVEHFIGGAQMTAHYFYLTADSLHPQ